MAGRPHLPSLTLTAHTIQPFYGHRFKPRFCYVGHARPPTASWTAQTASPRASSRSRGPAQAAHAETAEARCIRCSGEGIVVCPACGGSGTLGRGGFHKRNTFDSRRVVGSTWTAMERTFGWRHFHVTASRQLGKTRLALLVATCDQDVKLWVPVKTLRDRDRWASGWLPRAEMEGLEQGVAATQGCKGCQSTGIAACPGCGGSGAQSALLEIG